VVKNKLHYIWRPLEKILPTPMALSKTNTNLFFHELTFLLNWYGNDTNCWCFEN